MAFTDIQNKALSAKLSAKHVRTREKGGRTLSYVEGWRAIAEANRIFGYDAWDRETLSVKCLWQGERRGLHECSYAAKVRVHVRAGPVVVRRDGTGCGHGSSWIAGEAHESALKEAETDALKRALVTFGNPFGLALYDATRARVRRAPPRTAAAEKWMLLAADGGVLKELDRADEYVRVLSNMIEAATDLDGLHALWEKNRANLAVIQKRYPDLDGKSRTHACERLALLYQQKAKHLTKPDPPASVNGHSVDKSALAIGEPKRLRDKAHLEHVAKQPCLICGRRPSQSHHLRFAQPRALGRKVSDEWVVPVCAVHHRALHDHGDEQKWWSAQGLEPIVVAQELWGARAD